MAKATPVIMVRSIPTCVTERMLEKWASSFVYHTRGGQVGRTQCVKSLILADRLIAFVQLKDLEQAQHIMATFHQCPESIAITIDGVSHPLNLLYSDKEEITARSKSCVRECSSRVLLVILKGLTSPLLLDDLFWLFTQFGEVQKMSAFVKDGKNQVLIQFARLDAADAAIQHLDRQPLEFDSLDVASVHDFSDFGTPPAFTSKDECKMSVLSSKIDELTFKTPDQRNRDYSCLNTLLQTTFDEAARGEVQLTEAIARLAKTWGWRTRDFIWGTWVAGEGWLYPRQEGQRRGYFVQY